MIRRLKSHFYHLPPPCGPTGVDVILGLNGYVWVSLGTTQEKRDGGDGFDAEGVYSDKNDVSFILVIHPNSKEITPEGRNAISVVATIIQNFARNSIPLTDVVIAEGYQWFVSSGAGVRDLDGQVGRDLIAAVTGVDVDESNE